MAILNQVRECTVVSQTDPGTIWESSSWNSINNVKTPGDGAYSYATILDQIIGNQNRRDTYYLYTKTYGFSIPANSTIKGIKVGIVAANSISVGGPGDPQNIQFFLMKNGTSTVGTAKFAVVTYGGSFNQYILGTGQTDLWGTTWTLTDINAAGFGCRFYLEASSSDINGPIAIEGVQIQVFYETPTNTSDSRDVRVSGKASSASPTNDVRITGRSQFQERDVRLTGRDSSNRSQDVFLECTVHSDAVDRNVRITGRNSIERFQNVKITGQATLSTDRGTYLNGILGSIVELGVYIRGVALSNRTQDVRVIGAIPSSRAQDFMVDTRGELSNTTRVIELIGSINAEADREVSIIGSNDRAVERQVKIIGKGRPVSEWFKSWEYRVSDFFYRTSREGRRHSRE